MTARKPSELPSSRAHRPESGTVVLAARRADLLDNIVADITANGGTARSVPTDLSDAEQTSALVKTTLDALGRVDVLVNNAGYGPPFALEQMDRTAMRHVFDVNLLAGMQLIAEVTPTMREQGGGRIVNISSCSVRGHQGWHGSHERVHASRTLAVEHSAERDRARVRRHADIRQVSTSRRAPPGRPEQPLPAVDVRSRRLCRRPTKECRSSRGGRQSGGQSGDRVLAKDPIFRSQVGADGGTNVRVPARPRRRPTPTQDVQVGTVGMSARPVKQGPKRVLVTGAAKGIGAAIIHLCIEAGHEVVAVDVDREGLSRLRQELPGIETAVLDVRDLAAWERVVEAAETQGGPIDVLINNAGVCLPGPCDQVSAEEDRLTVEVNLMGVLHGVRTVLPRFLARNRGHVINVASMAAFSPIPDLAAYSATKHAVRAYTHSCALDHRHVAIDWTLACPSAVETPMLEGMRKRRAGVVVFTEKP
ncbi:MAG: SDR family NAD(P)-dependent oxidoreductase, partial [Deltaproteobacteria bacterium]|nr:SDR family NAD(P)-dependent oxidoreductase [Deltaproteobacteria bacterium]